MPNPDSLQKKLELRRQRHMAQRANKQWQDGYCSAIDDFQKDVRSCASSIQRDIDKRKDNTKVKYSDFPIPNFGFRSYWKGYLEAKEEDRKLLVGSSSPSNADNTKCYNDECWNNDKTKHKCKQHYYGIDEYDSYRAEGSSKSASAEVK